MNTIPRYLKGENHYWSFEGITHTGAGYFLAAAHKYWKPAPGSASNDFTADGRGDILWHNSLTGESQIWFMSGSSRVGRATVLDASGPAMIGPPWRIAGSNDFNGDGKTDLLRHNNSTGETQIWHMDGHRRGGRATVLGENGTPAMVGLPWSIVGSNDMNGDGKSDIIWYNGTTGHVQTGHLDGHTVTARATAVDENGNAISIGPPWTIVGSSDFNADGKTDLLWHNGSTGHTQTWNMNGNRIIGRATVVDETGSEILVGLPWRITGTNDFDQNGTADILWHNGATGHTQIWMMKGHAIVVRATVEADRDGRDALVRAPWSVMNH